MKRNFYGVCFVLMLSALFHMGTIRRADDPIRKTQTDPIKYEKKKEELKEGPKGAPSPFFRFFPRFRFWQDPPMTEEPMAEEGYEERIPEYGEPIPEDLTGTADEELEELWEESWEEPWENENLFKEMPEKGEN